jgi:hypothetical protein
MVVDPSVADPGCLSRIPDPDFYPFRIQKQQQKTGVKKIFCQTIFCRHKFHKTQYYFIFDILQKKIWPNFPRIIVTKPSKIWVWDPGSGKNLFQIPDPDLQHWWIRIETWFQCGSGSRSSIFCQWGSG